MSRFSHLLLGVLAAGMVMAMTETARADILSSCGNIDVQASAMCQLQTSGGCTAQCTPISFEASCAAKLEASCSGMCMATADVNCTSSCQASCMGSCMANPGSFNCQGSCEADCDGSCQGECSSMTSGSMTQSQCMASCKASCGANCSAKCTGTPPSASCQAQCMASCSGSCTAQANLNCDVTCQESGYANCEASLMGGCTAQCSQPMGALFCDGQYVDTGNNLQMCIDDLKAALNITVMASASGQCSGNTCTGKANASASCALSPGSTPWSGGSLLAGLGLGLAVLVRRRTKR